MREEIDDNGFGARRKIMEDNRTVRVTVLEAEQYENGFPPDKLLQFKEWLDEIIDKIPEQYRAEAKIDFNSVSGYEGSHYANVEIKYRRPETPEEKKQRELENQQQADLRLSQERATFEALKRKFEG